MGTMINSITFGSETYPLSLPYGVCETAEGTAVKTVTVDNFYLETGASVIIKFTHANSVANPTLNVNNTGAKIIYWHGAALASSQYWQAGATLQFVYNGTQWELMSIAKDNNDITATATDDDIIILTGSSEANSVSYDAKHKQYNSTYTSSNTTTSISGSGGSGTIKIPQITVDAYGHVTAAADESITITMPTIPTNHMIFKGTLGEDGIVTKLPTASASTIGHTYKVINDGTYADVEASIGDLYVCSDPPAWIHIPSGDDEYKGTVTSVATGIGLTGGTITTSGTIKANLRSETALTLDSTTATTTEGRVYPVAVDKSGYLSTNVPWTDTKVMQAAVITTDGDYPALLGYSTATTALTNTVNKASTLTFNPSTGFLKLGKTNGGLLLNNGTTTPSGYPRITWGTINSLSPFIGYAEDQTDGTFLLLSATGGSSYKNGLAIGGSSGNLLWKGNAVATIDQIPANTDITKVTAGNGLTGGGSAASSTGVTLNVGAGTGISVTEDAVSLATYGTNGTYGPSQTANTTLTHSGTFTVPKITTDSYGRVTASNITFTLPADTDTKNTAGSTNSSSKLFLVGATSQTTNPVTYSHDTIYAGTDGCVYSNSQRVPNIYVGTSAPTGKVFLNDLWIDTTNGLKYCTTAGTGSAAVWTAVPVSWT